MVAMTTPADRSHLCLPIGKSYRPRNTKQKRLQQAKLKQYCSIKENRKAPVTNLGRVNEVKIDLEDEKNEAERGTESARRQLLRKLSNASGNGGIPSTLSRCYRRCSTVSLEVSLYLLLVVLK